MEIMNFLMAVFVFVLFFWGGWFKTKELFQEGFAWEDEARTYHQKEKLRIFHHFHTCGADVQPPPLKGHLSCITKF